MELALAILMTVLGVLSHVLKEVVTARQTDGQLHLGDYVTRHPYQLALMCIGAVIAFVTLWETGNLSNMSAFMGGYMANSVADIIGDRAKLAKKMGVD